MALRFCKGKYLIIDNKNIANVKKEEYFKTNNEKFIIITKQNNIYAYMDKSQNIYYDFVNKDNCFDEAKNLLKINELEYIPVIDNNKIIGFCYNDEYLDDALNKIKDLIAFADAEIFKQKYNTAIIYNYNELAYYLEKLFKKCNMNYEIKDDIFYNNNSIFKTDKTMELYVEGNLGESLNNYAFWKVFHEWLYYSIKPIYDIYKELNSFKYSDEKYIVECLKNNKPFMMARIGNTELWIIKQYIQKKLKIINNYNDFWLNFFFNTSGFFAKDNNVNEVDNYAKESIESIKNCDFNLCYGNDELAEGLNLVLSTLQENNKNFNWDLLCNPFNNNWFSHLKNKKVLIISPYSKSIEEQKNKLYKLYNHEYPNMQIITYQCLQTQLNNNMGYDTFFEALEKMKVDISKIDFDIAFICAGAYGFLLASYVKNIGKSSIEICSYLPNWFGVKIKRYCTNIRINKFWNEHWIFPVEKPLDNSEKIEDNCYWE
ncbi:MAG: hypothetical protein Q4G04_00400 [bacterium]|nr:hypothetical protein [bacterium]